jgi:hypothetical protein
MGKIKFRRKARLTSDKSGYELTLEVEPEEADQFEKKFHTITTSDNSSRITLFDCVGYKNMSFPFRHDVSIRIMPSHVIHQVMGNSLTPFVTNNLKASVLGMEHFFDKNLLKYNRDQRAFLEKQDYIHEVEIAEGFKVALHLDLDVESYRNSDFSAKHNSYAEFVFSKKIPYSLAVGYFKALEEFFNFVFSETTDVDIFYSSRKKRGKYNYLCEINCSGSRIIDKTELRSAYNLLFNINDLSDPSATIKNWIFSYPNNIEKIWNAIKYLKTHAVSENDRFLTLVRVIEGVHRLADDSKNQERTKDHQVRVQRIVSQIENSKDKEFVSRALEFKYEPSMRKRLTEINQLAKSLNTSALDKTTINKILNTRNKLVHNLAIDPNKKYLTYSEMYDCNNTLAMQIKVILMIVLRLPDETIKSIVVKSNQFKSYYRDGAASSFFEV